MQALVMRLLFIAYLLVPVAGIALYVAIALANG